MKITESDLDRVFNKKSGGSGKIKITDDDLDRVFGQNERRQENAALPVSAPKTEIKTDYSQPQSNYDRVQQVAAKQTSAQLKQPDTGNEKRYIINPITQTATPVEQTISGGVLEKAASAVGDYLHYRYKNKGGQLSDYDKQVMYNQGGVKGEDAGDSRAGHVVAASALNTVGGLATAVEGLAQFSNSDNYNRRMMYNQGAGAARGAVQDIQHRKETKLNTDTFGTRTLAKAREETEAALAGLDPVEQFMTQTMISVLQNAYLMPVGMFAPVPASMAAGAVGVTLSDAMIKAIPGLVSTTLLSTSAAGNTMYDETTEGKNLQQAFTRGVIDGSIEFATEKIGVDRWLEMLAGKGGSTIKKLLMMSGSEAGEEALSYIAGYLMDVAEKEPDAAFSAQELMLSALGGAVSGMILGGGAAFAGVDIGGETDIRTQAQTAEQAQGQADAQTGMQARPRIDEQIRRRAAQNLSAVQRLAENGIAPQSDVDALTDTIVGENGESRRQVAQVAAAENRKVDTMRQLAESGIADRQDLAKVQQAARENVRKAISEDITYTTEKENGYGTLQTDQRLGRGGAQQEFGIPSKRPERMGKISETGDSQRYAKRDSRAFPFQNRENRGLTAEQRQELDKTAVRDKSGRPERVYHYTANTEFTQFGESRDVGFHFGNLRQASGRRADLKQSGGRIIRGYLNIKNPVNIGNDIMGYKPGALAIKLNVIGILNENDKNTIIGISQKDDGSYNSRSAKALRALLAEKGYDGIVYNNLYEGEGRSYIAFYPQQVIWAEENFDNITRTMQAVEEFAAGKGLKVEYFSDGDRRAPEGYVTGDTVYINMASDAPIVGVAVHEVGHRLKDGNTRRWNRYARSVSRLLSTNRELAEFAAQVRDSYTDPDSVRYSGMLDENGNIDRAKVDEEVILKVTQEILKRTAGGDSAILQQITADRSLVDRLLDFIRGIKNSITIKLTGSEMAMLDEAERNLVNLMRGEIRPVEEVRYSKISGFFEQLKKAREGKLSKNTYLKVLDKTPGLYAKFGFDIEKPILITQKHAIDVTTPEDGINENYHGLSDVQVKKTIKALGEPVMLFESLTVPGRIVAVVDVIDDKKRPIIVALEPEAGGFVGIEYTPNNLIASLYGKDQFKRFFADNVTSNNLLYVDKIKSRHMAVIPGVQFPSNIPVVDFNRNIQKYIQNVNTLKAKKQKKANRSKKQPDSGMFSLHIDSDGKKLTDEQAAYFADSQIRDDSGALMKVYHQTGADFTRFDTDRAGAGQYDAEMPTGIFTKPTADDIGLGGQKQMELYANITNPLRFNNRAEAVRYWERNIEGYRQARRRIENLDNEYQEKYDAADLLEEKEYERLWQRLEDGKITQEEFMERQTSAETERILNEWTEKSNELRRQAKALIDEYISKSGYDGVIVENDTGSFGRRVKSIIALNSNQLKNTDNLTPTADDDIRYSLDIRQQVLQQTAKADNIKNRAVSDFTRQVRDIFGIDSSVSADIKTAVQDMATEVLDNGYVSPAAANRLFDKALQLGSEIDDNYRRYEELRKRINRTGIEPVGGAEYRDFLAKYRGKVKFKRGGIPLDTFYRELQEMYPEYFPDINNIYDQMEQIGRVYDDISNKFVSLEDYYGEAFRDFKEMSRTEFMERLDRFTAKVNSAYRYNEALGQQQRRRQFANKAAASGVDYDKAMQSFESVTELDNQIERLKKQYAFTDSEIKLVEYMVGQKGRVLQSRKDMVRTFPYNGEHILTLYELSKEKREIMRPLNDIYARQKDDARAKTIKFMRSMRLAKEKQSFRGLRYTTRSFERTVDRLIKDPKQNEAFKDEYVRPVHKAVTDAQRMKNEYRDKVRRLNLDQKKKYDVKFENRQGTLIQGKLSESGLVQAYGEGLINDSYLEQLGADSAKIKAAAGELKKIYRGLYRQINETYIRNGYRPMEHRRDYFPHFQEEDGFIDKIRAKLGMGPQEELPIDIAGLTSRFTPGRKWNRFALQRTTDTTAYDALRGFDMYIETAADVIHTTDIIQKLRMLESSIRYMYSDRGVKAQLDEIDNNTNLSPNEKLEMKNKVYADLDKNNSGRGLTGFVQWLHGYTNGLAGKKSDADRDVEFKLGRGIYTFSKNFEGRVAANMIGGNISSALTNFIPITQMTAEVKGKYILAAMYDTMKNLHTNDGFDRQSDFLVRRFGSERLYETFWDKIVNAPVIGQVYNLMELVDEFSSNVVTRGMYIQKINEGMESRSAMQYADEFAARLMADRSKGALPTIYNEQNPIKKLFTMFQVEQANQFQYLVGDLPRIAGASGKPLRYLLFALFKMSLWALLYNRVYEKIAGRKPAFSPLDITFDAAEDVVQVAKGNKKASAALTENVGELAEQLPFIGGVLGGGRVPISSALPDLANLAKLWDKDISGDKKRQILFEELSNPLAYLALPGGGGQIRKIWQGAQLIADDGVMYATDNEGNRTVKFAVDINPLTRAQALAFGQWASEPAQEYINSFKGLGKTQTGVFEQMKKEGRSNSRAFAFAQTITKSEKEGGADADGNGYLKSEEVQSYLDKQTNLSQSAKANIFRLLMPDVEDNPYE